MMNYAWRSVEHKGVCKWKKHPGVEPLENLHFLSIGDVLHFSLKFFITKDSTNIFWIVYSKKSVQFILLAHRICGERIRTAKFQS